ncbi:hypothetical protein KQI42_15795 [Tissierella sp. MSJ-40]|uniref:Phage protein n=1 Tax=Tissierella simiarum TaxID=2841534 RepID=A0ABS6EBD7_9FIRM|nr:hypothetical protein [Tissierella simiarum]MBU5439478.1 hypothetical protein [Tissierella simiarum]
MKDKKIIVFCYRYGPGDHNTTKVEIEFDKDATEEEINETYVDWILETVREKCTWYEKED